jgi:hypothetical protein
LIEIKVFGGCRDGRAAKCVNRHPDVGVIGADTIESGFQVGLEGAHRAARHVRGSAALGKLDAMSRPRTKHESGTSQEHPRNILQATARWHPAPARGGRCEVGSHGTRTFSALKFNK